MEIIDRLRSGLMILKEFRTSFNYNCLYSLLYQFRRIITLYVYKPQFRYIIFGEIPPFYKQLKINKKPRNIIEVTFNVRKLDAFIY